MTVAFHRHLNVLRHALAGLARRPGRMGALLVVYATVVAALASVLLFGHALRAEADRLLAQAPDVLVQQISAGRHALMPAEAVTALADIRGARNARPRLWGYYNDAANGANYTVRARIQAPPPPEHAVIGAGVARARAVAVGDYLFLQTPDGAPFRLRVADILPDHTELATADWILLGEADVRRLFALPDGVYTDLALTVRNPAEIPTVATKIAEALPGSRVLTRDDLARSYQSVFDWREGVGLVLMAGAVLAFLLLAAEHAAGLSHEERREIGLLKAVGWETADVLRLKLWEGALVSVTAFLVGYLLAWAHVFLFGAPLLRPLLRGWAVLYPRVDLPAVVDPLQVSLLLLLTVVPYTAATLIPAWRAATLDPDSAMRGA